MRGKKQSRDLMPYSVWVMKAMLEQGQFSTAHHATQDVTTELKRPSILTTPSSNPRLTV